MNTFSKNHILEYRLAPHAVFLPVQDNSGRMLDLNGNFYSLSVIGAGMMSAALNNKLELEVGRIANLYDVDPRKVWQDAFSLLREFRRKGVLLDRPCNLRLTLLNFVAKLILLPLLSAIRFLVWPCPVRIWFLLLLSRISFSLFGWERTVRITQSCWKPISYRKPNDTEGMLQKIDTLVRTMASTHPFQIQCKERSLCCWAITRSLGIKTRLVVGVQVFPLEGHCWCEYEDTILTDDNIRCKNYRTLRTYQ